MAKPQKKDLPVSKDVKGGRLGSTNQDNLTLVRAAKLAKKDLPAGGRASRGQAS